MPDLAAVAGRAGQGPPVDDDAAADADLARDVDDVVGAERRAAARLGQGAEVGLVGDDDRHLRRQAPRPARSASGTSGQPRFGAVRHETVAAPDDAGHGHADADQRIGLERDPVGRRRPRAARSATTWSTVVWPRGRSTRRMLDDLAGRADVRDRQRVDGDLQGQDGDALAIERDDG